MGAHRLSAFLGWRSRGVAVEVGAAACCVFLACRGAVASGLCAGLPRQTRALFIAGIFCNGASNFCGGVVESTLRGAAYVRYFRAGGAIYASPERLECFGPPRGSRACARDRAAAGDSDGARRARAKMR